MEKFMRFGILVMLYVLSFVIFYSIIPTLVWIFGGSFTSVAQSVVYVIVGNILAHVTLGAIFHECFDTNFKSKK